MISEAKNDGAVGIVKASHLRNMTMINTSEGTKHMSSA